MKLRHLAIYFTFGILLYSCSPFKEIAKLPLKQIENTTPAKNVSDEVLKTWAHADINKDSLPGISLQDAYGLLEGKRSKKVIVGVIDSGIDINHEDFAGVIRVNPKEVPNNGIDDDKNGYADDINGWNFLGNINQATLEVVRVLQKGAENNPDYAAAEKKYQEELEETRGHLTMFKSFKQSIVDADKMVREILKKDDYSLADLENIDVPEDDPLKQQFVMIVSSILLNGSSVKEAIDGLKDAEKYYDVKLNFHLNKEFYPRTIVGDDVENIADKQYGDNNVIGPDIEGALHGTHVAGIIAAKRNNGVGMDGVAENVEILCVRAVPDGDEYDKDIALAIRYAVDNGAKVINTSFGKPFSPNFPWVKEAIEYAAKHDVLIVNAAGNDTKNIDENATYPADDIDGVEYVDNMITIGALNYEYGSKIMAPFSNYGKKNVDIFAPGVKIWSTVPNNEYKFLQGTSMASPEVAGIAALIRSYFPKLSAKQVKEVILESGLAVDIDHVEVGDRTEPFANLSKTGKIVNAYNAIIIAARKK